MKKILIINEFTTLRANSTGYLFASLIQDISGFGEITTINLEDHRKSRNKILNSFYLMVRFFKVRNSYDIIVVGSNPPLLIFLIFIIKFFTKVPVYLYFMDLFPLNLVCAGYLKKSSIIYKCLKQLVIICLKKFDYLLVLGKDMKDLLIEHGIVETKIVYYPIIIPFSQKHNRTNKINSTILQIQFLGNIGKLQNLPQIINTFNDTQVSGWDLEIIGNGSEASNVQRLISTIANDNITYKSGIPMSKRADYMSKVDIALVSLIPGSKGVAVPSKAHFNFAAGIAVFAFLDEGSELYNLINDYDLGIVISDLDNNQFDQALIEVINNGKLKYDTSAVRKRYAKYINDVTQTRQKLQNLIKLC